MAKVNFDRFVVVNKLKEYWFFGHQFEFTGIVVLQPGIQTIGTMAKR